MNRRSFFGLLPFAPLAVLAEPKADEPVPQLVPLVAVPLSDADVERIAAARDRVRRVGLFNVYKIGRGTLVPAKGGA